AKAAEVIVTAKWLSPPGRRRSGRHGDAIRRPRRAGSAKTARLACDGSCRRHSRRGVSGRPGPVLQLGGRSEKAGEFVDDVMDVVSVGLGNRPIETGAEPGRGHAELRGR